MRQVRSQEIGEFCSFEKAVYAAWSMLKGWLVLPVVEVSSQLTLPSFHLLNRSA
jgi:hypothetical protein